jgi:hypothetical protein
VEAVNNQNISSMYTAGHSVPRCIYLGAWGSFEVRSVILASSTEAKAYSDPTILRNLRESLKTGVMVCQASHNAPDVLRVGEATIHETIGLKEKVGQGLK